MFTTDLNPSRYGRVNSFHQAKVSAFVVDQYRGMRTPIFLIMLAVTSQAFAARLPHNAEYLGGTVGSIPANTQGILDLRDKTQMQFSYGDSTYHVDYRHIDGFKLSEGPSGHRRIAHVPVPAIMGHAQILDVTFRDESGKVGMLSFRLSWKTASVAQHLLSERTSPKQKAEASKPQDPWWGDNYWKTNRNQANWAGGMSTGDITAGGSK
jgi:hypothetical protein